VEEPEAGRHGAYPRGQRPLHLGRRQPRRADRGLQFAERRACHQGEGRQARHAEERAGGEVQEAKADISGLWALQQLVDKGVIDKAMEKTMYTTYLASAFRSIRFGTSEAHGKGVAMQLNYLIDAGAFVLKNGAFTVDVAKVKPAVTALTKELMTIQAEGNKAKAADLLSRLGVVRPEIQKILDKLIKVPVDIAPRFTTAEKVLADSAAVATR
jgi:hypothetical protein